jgi:hypothetical protein
MLYDPKWEVETKADPFSLESLIAWLEKQPADGEYNWDDGSECLLGQWLKTIDPKVECDFIRQPNLYLYQVLDQPVDLKKFETIVRDTDTFGAALYRARAALAAS